MVGQTRLLQYDTETGAAIYVDLHTEVFRKPSHFYPHHPERLKHKQEVFPDWGRPELKVQEGL